MDLFLSPDGGRGVGMGVGLGDTYSAGFFRKRQSQSLDCIYVCCHTVSIRHIAVMLQHFPWAYTSNRSTFQTTQSER
jgi:hypothetical protein